MGSDADKTPREANPDPITGAPGSHPVGTGIGAAGGAATGAAIGSLGGPVGAMVGGVAGAVVGGLVGKGIGEAVDPTEDRYWRDNYSNRPYYRDGYAYEAYEPAYRLGYNAYDMQAEDDRDFEDMDDDLRSAYDQRRGRSPLEWDDVRHAARDAWDRRRTGGTSTPRTGGKMM
jgi:phage tail tape-measure protein